MIVRCWLAVAALVAAPGARAARLEVGRMPDIQEKSHALPAPLVRGSTSLEQTLRARRSVRELGGATLSDLQLSQLLWAAQGTSGDGKRTAPSAGALYPLELYVATASGLAHYEPGPHQLTPRGARDLRAELRRAAHDQDAVGEAPAVFVIAAVYERTEYKYGRERGARYVHMEAGHAAQNLLLEATALGLAGVPVGAFDDARIARTLGLPAAERPLYLIPVGRPRGAAGTDR